MIAGWLPGEIRGQSNDRAVMYRSELTNLFLAQGLRWFDAQAGSPQDAENRSQKDIRIDRKMIYWAMFW